MRFGDHRVVARITMADGTVQATPDDLIPFDRICFERRFGISWGSWDVLLDEHLLYMAWVQSHRADLASGALAVGAFDGWLVEVTSAEFDVQEDEADAVVPTVPTASIT